MPKLPLISRWPVLRQLRARDVGGLGATAASERTRALQPRTRSADRVVRSVCPYCAVGCGQLAYVKDERITDIEGDPDSPVSQGCLCPEGAATFQLVTGSHRQEHVLHRRPGGTAWEPIPLERAMDMVAERVKRTRDETWQERVDGDGRAQGQAEEPAPAPQGAPTRSAAPPRGIDLERAGGLGGPDSRPPQHETKQVRRTLGIAHLGGATLDNEENYLLKKLFSALGVVQVENQARI